MSSVSILNGPVPVPIQALSASTKLKRTETYSNPVWIEIETVKNVHESRFGVGQLMAYRHRAESQKAS